MSVRLTGAVCLSTAVVIGATHLRSQDATALDLYRLRVQADVAREAGDEQRALAAYLRVAEQQPENSEVWTEALADVFAAGIPDYGPRPGRSERTPS